MLNNDNELPSRTQLRRDTVALVCLGSTKDMEQRKRANSDIVHEPPMRAELRRDKELPKPALRTDIVAPMFSQSSNDIELASLAQSNTDNELPI